MYISGVVLMVDTVENEKNLEGNCKRCPQGKMKWLPSQHALLREILVINLIGAFNYSGRLIRGMC